MPQNAPKPLRITLVNLLSLPAVVLLPYMVALLIATNGLTSNNAIGVALQVFEVFLYTGPLLLIGWTFWIYRRLNQLSIFPAIKRLNQGILVLPYAVLLLVGGYFTGKKSYQWYQHRQILEKRTVTTFHLPDSLRANHYIGHLSSANERLWLLPDSSLRRKSEDSAKGVCCIFYGWNDNLQEADTHYFQPQHLKSYSFGKDSVFAQTLAKAQWKPATDQCLKWGQQRAKPEYTGISRYGSQNGNAQFEAYVAGADQVESVLTGFKPFDYKLLTNLITDSNGRHWFFLREGQTLSAGFLKKDGQNRVYQLKGDYQLPEDSQKPEVKQVVVTDERVWFSTRETLFRFPLYR